MRGFVAVLLLLLAVPAIAPSHFGMTGPQRGSAEAAAGEARVAAGVVPLPFVAESSGVATLTVQPGVSVSLEVASRLPQAAGVRALVLSVTPGSGQSTVEVSVRRTLVPPTAPPPGAVHSYLEITPSAPGSGDVAVEADCGWLQKLDIPFPASRVRVYHLSATGRWEPLSTNFVPDATCGVIAFSTPSFSWFSIGVEPEAGAQAVSGAAGGAPRQPGFEAVFAVAGLLIVSYAVSRRGRRDG